MGAHVLVRECLCGVSLGGCVCVCVCVCVFCRPLSFSLFPLLRNRSQQLSSTYIETVHRVMKKDIPCVVCVCVCVCVFADRHELVLFFGGFSKGFSP